MKSGKLLIAIAIGLCLALTPLSFAADGAATFKAKCAMCHGADGGARSAPRSRYSQERDEIATFITTGRSQEGSAQEADRRRLGGGCQGRRRLYQEPEVAFHNAGSAPYRKLGALLFAPRHSWWGEPIRF